MRKYVTVIAASALLCMSCFGLAAYAAERSGWTEETLYPSFEGKANPRIRTGLFGDEEKAFEENKPPFDLSRPRWTTNYVKLFVDREEIFPAAFDLMKRARKDFLFNMYLFGGEIGKTTSNLLKEAQDRGVKVRMIIPEPSLLKRIYMRMNTLFKKMHDSFQEDILGREVPPPPEPDYHPMYSYAKKLGLNIAPSNTKVLNGPSLSMANLDHSKLLVRDGVEAMFGGMNFADTVASNHDAMMLIVGPAVEDLQKFFADHWYHDTGDREDAEACLTYDPEAEEILMKEKAQEGWIRVETTMTFSSPYYNTTKPYLLHYIDNAKETIEIEMLLLTDAECIEALRRAAERGVKVRILLDPNESLYGFDMKGAPNIIAVAALQGVDNVEVRHFVPIPGQELHMKFIVVDGGIVGFGSTNWTERAFDSNYEIYAFMVSEELASRFRKVFEFDWENVAEKIPPLDEKDMKRAAFWKRLEHRY